MKIPPPYKIPTPYGGRLTWVLPGGNLLIAHLKDKMKIRHKKRWSQVMYIYYLMGYKLLGDLEIVEKLYKKKLKMYHIYSLYIRHTVKAAFLLRTVPQRTREYYSVL